ncbi:uncharacterized protein BJ212DRAFT_1328641, partial [Suillus subaureus]
MYLVLLYTIFSLPRSFSNSLMPCHPVMDAFTFCDLLNLDCPSASIPQVPLAASLCIL